MNSETIKKFGDNNKQLFLNYTMHNIFRHSHHRSKQKAKKSLESVTQKGKNAIVFQNFKRLNMLLLLLKKKKLEKILSLNLFFPISTYSLSKM